MKELIVITGGTKGIGRALVERFVQDKYEVLTCSRDESALKALADDIKKTYGKTILTIPADFSKSEDVKLFSGYVLKQNLPIACLINNVGIYQPGQLLDEKEGVLEWILQVNLMSAYQITRNLVPEMLKHKSGIIINICSTASKYPFSNGGAYGISKFALLGMTKILREELKERNIKVIAILPGATDTASWENEPVDKEKLMNAKDVAETVYSAFSLKGNAVIEEVIIKPQRGDISSNDFN